MSWADCSPPALDSVDMPDVAPWERDDEIAREQDWWEDCGSLADMPVQDATPGAVTAIGPEWSSQSGRHVSERIDYDHQAALAGSLR